jgi:hypothetical protein
MSEQYRVPVGSPSWRRLQAKKLATFRATRVQPSVRSGRAKPRRPDPVKLAAKRAERRKARGLDPREPVGDEWVR